MEGVELSTYTMLVITVSGTSDIKWPVNQVRNTDNVNSMYGIKLRNAKTVVVNGVHHGRKDTAIPKKHQPPATATATIVR